MSAAAGRRRKRESESKRGRIDHPMGTEQYQPDAEFADLFPDTIPKSFYQDQAAELAKLAKEASELLCQQRSEWFHWRCLDCKWDDIVEDTSILPYGNKVDKMAEFMNVPTCTLDERPDQAANYLGRLFKDNVIGKYEVSKRKVILLRAKKNVIEILRNGRSIDDTSTPETPVRPLATAMGNVSATAGTPDDSRRLAEAEEHLDAPMFFCGLFVMLFIFAIVYLYKRRVTKSKRQARAGDPSTPAEKTWMGL